jgi:transcriptional repressor NrdR
LKRVDLNKIVRGLQKACEKKPVLAERVRQDRTMLGKACARELEYELLAAEIEQLPVVHGCRDQDYLKKLDRVAYVRFASVYKSFEEPEDFTRVLKEVRA